MVRQPEARPGFTLTEVLMALFVMGIGMISLLSLFPLGMINARWAIDNDQVSRGAANAQSMSEIARVNVNQPVGNIPLISGTAQHVRNDDSYRPEGSNGSMRWQVIVGDPVVAPIAQPRINSTLGRDSFLKCATTSTWTFNRNTNSPKPVVNVSPYNVTILPNSKVMYPPVFVDPFVATSFIDPQTTLPFHVGVDGKVPGAGNKTPFAWALPGSFPVLSANTNVALRPDFSVGIPRFSTSQYQQDLLAGNSILSMNLRMQTETSMGDEVNFGSNGQPITNNNVSNIATGMYASQRRFTWGYMCHWFNYDTPEVCDVAAAVFNTRPTNGGLATFPPGETTYNGYPAVAFQAGIEGAGNNFGRAFVKGLNQAAMKLTTAEASPIKAGDWILDSTMILPEFDSAFPAETAPFLDEYHYQAVYAFPQASGPPHLLRPGLAGGHFYKVLDISPVRTIPGPTPIFFQTITLDRPAKSDGFAATHIAGIADVITKGVGRMPQR